MYAIHSSTRITSHRHRHAHPCLSHPTSINSQPTYPRLADIERSSIGIDYMAGRHLVTSSASAPSSLCDPWALALRFGLGFAAAPPVAPKLHQTAPSHACTQHAEQATPVRAKVTARPRPRPITACLHSRVPELSRRAAACV